MSTMVTSSDVYLVDDRRKSHHYYFDYRVSVSKWRTAFLGQPLGCTCTRLKPIMSYSSPLDWKSQFTISGLDNKKLLPDLDNTVKNRCAISRKYYIKVNKFNHFCIASQFG